MAYPEWFIGGPLSGSVKTNTHPDTPENGVIPITEEVEIKTSTGTLTAELVWKYSRHTYALGTVLIPFWCDERHTSRELILTQLGEFIMAPHYYEPREKCVCTDSLRSKSGECPSKYDSEYNMCPRRSGRIQDFLNARNETQEGDEK